MYCDGHLQFLRHRINLATWCAISPRTPKSSYRPTRSNAIRERTSVRCSPIRDGVNWAFNNKDRIASDLEILFHPHFP